MMRLLYQTGQREVLPASVTHYRTIIFLDRAGNMRNLITIIFSTSVACMSLIILGDSRLTVPYHKWPALLTRPTCNCLSRYNFLLYNRSSRRGARAVEWDGLENRYGGNSIEGSNPSPSATHVATSLPHQITTWTAIRIVNQIRLRDLTYSVRDLRC